MGKYKMDMSEETEVRGNEVFSEGWYDWEIVNMEEQTSKQGNQMFKISVALADNPNKGLVIYAVAEPKKRWFLKNLLNAVGCEGGQDGIYDWDIEDVIGYTVSGRIENSIELWKDRNGKERKSTKSKIVEFSRMGVKSTTQEETPF
jgi:hypothetical protein